MMTEPRKNDKIEEQQGKRDHPEHYPTENESLFDRFESEQNVDPMPMEDLNMEKKEEKDKDATKSSSSSENAYPEGMAKRLEEQQKEKENNK
ncbi:hypothetical protein PTI45_00381 [Paenibacillus nuruki]|jgi:hypothetical protein|uniref:Uncharacterized protein n=2 Tax=Paenibacillus TaxID=44249 RepID=A0A1E3L8L7_9BACL|nr:hypothetical protein PTI45_00381 [Paenibacillus nuruki]CAJ1315460.1 DUF3408 domain-containing protein [Paenibacillus nuruki]